MMRPRSHHHRRNHSWPPFKLYHSEHKNIDEDPFSFFISNTDSAGSTADHMDADIDGAPRARSHSPKMGRSRAKLLASPTGKSIVRLKKWVEKMEVRYFHGKHHQLQSEAPPSTVPEIVVSEPDPPWPSLKRAAPSDELEEIIQSMPMPISPPLRGRRTRRSARRPYGNRMVRSHSKRARAWVEPGEDIWSVVEEDDEE